MKITLFYKSGGLLTRKAGALKLYVVPWGKQVSDLMWKKLPDSIRAKTISRQRHLTISKTKKETTCQLWKYVEKKYEKKSLIWGEAEQKCYLKLLRYNRTLVCKHHSPLKETKSAYWRCWFLGRERTKWDCIILHQESKAVSPKNLGCQKDTESRFFHSPNLKQFQQQNG